MQNRESSEHDETRKRKRERDEREELYYRRGERNDDEWFYIDHSGTVQGPFDSQSMSMWTIAGRFSYAPRIKLKQWSQFHSIAVVFPRSATAFKQMVREPGTTVVREMMTRPQQSQSQQRPQPESIALNKRITAAQSWQEVLQVLRAARPSVVRAVDVATAFHRVAKAGSRARQGPQKAELGFLLSLLETKIGDFKPQGVANTLWAYATLGLAPSASVMDKLSSAVERLARDFNPQGVTNTLWALCVLQMEPPRLLAIRASQLEAAFTEENLEQISYAHLVGQALGWSLQLPVELVQQAQSVQRRRAQQPTASQLQRRVYEALQGLGLEPQLEAPTDDGLFSVDMALAANERDGWPKTAVEVDGPHHFTSSGGKNGSTILRDFLLERRYGFRVVSLPYFEIDKARTDADLQAYLSAKMASSRP